MGADVSSYGGEEQTRVFFEAEHDAIRHRCNIWADEAMKFRMLGLRPVGIDADGSCGASSLCVAVSGCRSPSHEDKSERDRFYVVTGAEEGVYAEELVERLKYNSECSV